MEYIKIDNEYLLPVVALSMEQAARALGFTKKTSHKSIVRWLDENGVKTFKVLGQNRVHVDELKRKLEEIARR